MRNLGLIEFKKPIDAETFKKMLGKHERFSFLFTTDFDSILDMGYEGRYQDVAVAGANDHADKILEEYVPDLAGSMSDIDYDIVGYKRRNRMGIVTVKVTSSTEEFDFSE